MGLFSSLKDVARWAAVPTSAQVTSPVASPMSPSFGRRVVAADLAGVEVRELIDRAAAMRVPSVVKGRALIVGLLSRHPLAAYDSAMGLAATPLAGECPWLTSTSTPQSPRLRNLWTYDDFLFEGLSVWATNRLDDGTILDSYRLNTDVWTIDPDTRELLVDDKPVSREEYLLLEGPQEGLVTIAETTIRAALDLEAAWSARVRCPVPIQVLYAAEMAGDLEPTEAAELVDTWELRRRAGGTGFLPYGVKAEYPGADGDSQLFIEGRNAVRLDVANFLALPASALDGSLSTASLTYSTKEGDRNDLADLSLAYWANPLEARLSQDDIVPAGRNVAHDLTQLATPTEPTRTPNQED